MASVCGSVQLMDGFDADPSEALVSGSEDEDESDWSSGVVHGGWLPGWRGHVRVPAVCVCSAMVCFPMRFPGTPHLKNTSHFEGRLHIWRLCPNIPVGK